MDLIKYSCYENEVIHNNDPIFKKIKHTFLLTMNGSPRRPQYMEQLKKYPLTETVVIVHNSGYKVCKKDGINSPGQDLWHANKYVSGMISNEPVIILEDDVEFLPVIKEIASEVEDFVIGYRGPLCYRMGCIPFFSIPDDNHLRIFLGADTHGCIFNSEAVDKITSIHVSFLHDLEMSLYMDVYSHKNPMAIQEKENTENAQSWNVLGIPMFYINTVGQGNMELLYGRSHLIGSFGGIVPLLIMSLVLIFVVVIYFVKLRMKSGLYIAILVVILCIICQYQIYQDPKIYRLADFIRQVGGFEWILNRRFYAYQQHDTSIVRKYFSRTDTPNDIEALAQIVDEYDTGSFNCAIHVRLGDVIDNHKRSVSDFLHENIVHSGITDRAGDSSWSGDSCTMEECNSEGYVKPLSYFSEKLESVAFNIGDIVLISGSHKPTKHPEKSQEYLLHLKNFLQNKNYNVTIRWNKSADEDFVLLSKSKYIIVTGGGFSYLASKVAEKKGGIVL